MRLNLFRRPEPAPRPQYGTPEFARWLNGDLTKFCGHGYHEGDPRIGCKGVIRTLNIESPCMCSCHGREEVVADGDA